MLGKIHLQVWARLFKEAIPGLVQFCEFSVLHVFCLYCLHFRFEFEKSETAQKNIIFFNKKNEKWILRLTFNPGFASGTGFRATRQSVLKFCLRFLPLLERKWVNWQSPMRKNKLIQWKKFLLGQCLPLQVFPLSLLSYPKAQRHLNDPSVLLHSEFGLFPQVLLPVAHSSISEGYNGIQILLIQWFKSEEPWLP